MLRDCDPESKTSEERCPSCGSADGYLRHGGYLRHFDDGTGEKLVRVNRVKCRACGRTHAMMWAGMVPHRLRGQAVRERVARSRSLGASMRDLLASTGIPRTSLRRMMAALRRPAPEAASAASGCGRHPPETT